MKVETISYAVRFEAANDVILGDMTISAEVAEQVRKAMRSAAVAWERAILEAAFDSGLDVRTPWDKSVYQYAANAYRLVGGPAPVALKHNGAHLGFVGGMS